MESASGATRPVARVTLVSFLVLLDMSILGTAIPRITTEFNALPDVGWYIGAYNLAAYYTYLTFTLFFELGSLICGLAPSSSMFIGGRVIAGLGAAGIFNGGFTIISSAVPLDKSPLYTGILAGFTQLGIVAGPLIGGVLTERVTWRWCFYINLPVGGVVATLFVFVRIPEIIKKEPFTFDLVRQVLPELDLIGFALFAPAAVMFLVALQFGSGNTYAWDSATIIGLTCGAGVTALIFIAWEARMGNRAMIPGGMLRKRIVWTSCVFGSALMCCSIVASNWLPTYFQAAKGEGPMLSGVHILPSILSALLFVVITGAAITRQGYYLPWGLFCGILTAIGAGLVSMWTPKTSVAQWIGYQIIFGAGRGAGMQVPIVAVQNAVTSAQIPVAMAVLIFFQNFSTSVAGVVSNTIFTQTLTASIPKYAPSVSPAAALEAGSGASAVRDIVPAGHEEELDGLLRAYSDSLRNVFYFLVGLAVLATVVSLGMGWKDVKKKKGDSGEEAQATRKSNEV
ncbi:efflux pump protein [Macroventuria anomochaeta]|uniref:Efflux pump protein n=1 Tax=Macroventuria anomochaeta TaxID=301207 RepID=A0ACB6RX04_9PLEO|nr:efflux pump protein [Macroventuria anomochaeta]KAF2626431.1 efflux pump protein [Macroventuria anomochaeta]